MLVVLDQAIYDRMSACLTDQEKEEHRFAAVFLMWLDEPAVRHGRTARIFGDDAGEIRSCLSMAGHSEGNAIVLDHLRRAAWMAPLQDAFDFVGEQGR